MDYDDFDMRDTNGRESAQSITLGSKMNHDNLRSLGGGFDKEIGIHDEPPFA